MSAAASGFMSTSVAGDARNRACVDLDERRQVCALRHSFELLRARTVEQDPFDVWIIYRLAESSVQRARLHDVITSSLALGHAEEVVEVAQVHERRFDQCVSVRVRSAR